MRIIAVSTGAGMLALAIAAAAGSRLAVPALLVLAAAAKRHPIFRVSAIDG